MFNQKELELLETAVSAWVSEYEGLAEDDEIEEMRVLRRQLQAWKWMEEQTPVIFKDNGLEYVGVIERFQRPERHWAGVRTDTALIWVRSEQSMFTVKLTAITGPAGNRR
jgi:hypothetical protein